MHEDLGPATIIDIAQGRHERYPATDLAEVDRIFLELHDHVTGLSGVARLFATLADQGFVYDPRHSTGSVVLFQKVGPADILRPYAG